MTFPRWPTDRRPCRVVSSKHHVEVRDLISLGAAASRDPPGFIPRDELDVVAAKCRTTKKKSGAAGVGFVGKKKNRGGGRGGGGNGATRSGNDRAGAQ